MSAPAWYPESAKERDRMVALLARWQGAYGITIDAMISQLQAITFDTPTTVLRVVRFIPHGSGMDVSITFENGRYRMRNYACEHQGWDDCVEQIAKCVELPHDNGETFNKLLALRDNPTEPAPYVPSAECVGYWAERNKNGGIAVNTVSARCNINTCLQYIRENADSPIYELLRGPQVPTSRTVRSEQE